MWQENHGYRSAHGRKRSEAKSAMGTVINFSKREPPEDTDWVSTCPECGCQLWEILVRSPDDDSIIAFVCADCRFEIEPVEKTEFIPDWDS